MSKIAKSKDCLGLIQYLMTYKDLILDLPTSTKKAECTIMRFYLYLLPVVNLAIKQNAKEAGDIFTKFVDLLSTSNVALNTKITSFLHMFNATHNGLKAYVFKTLVTLC